MMILRHSGDKEDNVGIAKREWKRRCSAEGGSEKKRRERS
jgi:hypothetical protein